MAEKRKSRPVRVTRTGKGTRTSRDGVSGRFNYSAKTAAASALTRGEKPKPTPSKMVQAAPIEGDIDPHKFAQDLLVSDKWIMEYLSR
ncbi:hypothetical protein ASE36_03570 [Rhizobium sp. Root274]|uniref:hypothetical protein n=1 Tax=unclassified Rhizobium TaxID=2613769 RepID=UPI0007155725|nr:MULTISPECIES: hypothetical protein [unclassified Rhizobium]KQW31349.1 hypothetical protein ASC71_03570 [Rhizobium sp. Root1240]KRD32893.1 hypothetical protein ASE36_03570 [Rhizobium sp. Root274]